MALLGGVLSQNVEVLDFHLLIIFPHLLIVLDDALGALLGLLVLTELSHQYLVVKAEFLDNLALVDWLVSSLGGL